MHEKVKWGQNFLVNVGVLEKIIELSNLTKDDCVIEIGTGLGHLTKYLSQSCWKVITFEIDPNLYQKTFRSLSDLRNIVFFNQDFLQADLLQILNPYLKHPFKIVANIPYNISTPVLFKIVQAPLPWKMMVIMVQKEFGQKIIAQPDDRRRVALSVVFQMRFQVQQCLEVSRGSFQPMPLVNSVVL